jgi:hypothetical protein
MKPNLGQVLAMILFSIPALAAWANSDASERRFIREGMSESEVLEKIGKPDYKATAGSETSTMARGGSRARSASKAGKAGKTSKTSNSGKIGKTGKAGKTWAYRPDPRDPQTLTLVTMAQGKVVRVERKVER